MVVNLSTRFKKRTHKNNLMKQYHIRVDFQADDFLKLKLAKKLQTWHDFILELIEEDRKKEGGKNVTITQEI